MTAFKGIRTIYAIGAACLLLFAFSGYGHAEGSPDYSCKTDADCTVKDVGNCCGYFPACVNVNAKTDPEGVRAQCEKDGMASVCGFQEIQACACVNNRCQPEGGRVAK